MITYDTTAYHSSIGDDFKMSADQSGVSSKMIQNFTASYYETTLVSMNLKAQSLLNTRGILKLFDVDLHGFNFRGWTFHGFLRKQQIFCHEPFVCFQIFCLCSKRERMKPSIFLVVNGCCTVWRHQFYT